MKDSVAALISRLEKQAPVHSAEDAWDQISGVLAELNIPTTDGTPWIIPALNARSSKSYGLDGVALRLIGHQIFLNRNGAFRISELTDEVVPIFEKRAADGSEFTEVPGYRMPF